MCGGGQLREEEEEDEHEHLCSPPEYLQQGRKEAEGERKTGVLGLPEKWRKGKKDI